MQHWKKEKDLKLKILYIMPSIPLDEYLSNPSSTTHTIEKGLSLSGSCFGEVYSLSLFLNGHILLGP